VLEGGHGTHVLADHLHDLSGRDTRGGCGWESGVGVGWGGEVGRGGSGQGRSPCFFMREVGRKCLVVGSLACGVVVLVVQFKAPQALPWTTLNLLDDVSTLELGRAQARDGAQQSAPLHRGRGRRPFPSSATLRVRRPAPRCPVAVMSPTD
jgi:hypothetical protein